MNKLMGIGLASAVAVAALPFSLQANAAAMPEYTPAAPVSHAFNGFFLGVGLDFLSLKKKAEITSPDYFYDISTTFRGGEHTLGGNVFAGYGATFDSFYLSGELFAKYAPASEYTFEGTATSLPLDPDSDVYDVKAAKVTTDFSWGGDIRLGYLASPSTIVYFLIGAESAKFEVKNQYSIQDVTVDPDPVVNKFDKTKVGVMPGAGIETMLGDNVSLRAQYTYTFFGNFKKAFVLPMPADAAANSDPEYTTKITPERSDFSVDLTYQF